MARHICPSCGCNQSWSVRRQGRKCKKCRREWTPSRDWVAGIRAGRADWRVFLRCFLRYRTVAAIRLHTRQSHMSILKMSGAVRAVMIKDVPRQLSGVCEVDETYVGAQWRNQPWSMRRRGTKKGRGTSKQAIFGIYERRRKVVRAFFVENVRNYTILSLIERHVEKGSTIYSDAYQLYQNLPKLGYSHGFVDHSQNEYARGDVHSNSMESFWGYLKRRLKVTGGIRRDRLHLYVAEEVWRYNCRMLSETEKVERLLDLLR